MRIFIALLFFTLTIFAEDKKIQYLGDEYSRKEFEQAKKTEMNKFKKDILKLSCKEKFKFTNTKYYNIAYRSSQKQLKTIQNSMDLFYEKVYPKFFNTDPNFPFRIVIFKSQEEFTKCTKTPAGLLGYYFPYGDNFQSNTLFTFSDSGYGTYWHEIMHGFIDANTDVKPPDWFNEGLASFYEKGKIDEGYTNWRLPILQKAVKEKTFIPLKELVAKQSDKGAIAQSEFRFLFLYLWKKGKMESFVKLYLEKLLPNYKEQALTEKTIELFETLTNQKINEIEEEMQSLILKLESDVLVD